jgi:acyl-homoserine-lactone acylase
MKQLVVLLLLYLGACTSPGLDEARWEARADNVTITRDEWGIAHVHGRSDADAVFGMIYAQAEDDFNRIEVNYLNAMGRLAEAEGEQELWRDLRMRLFIDPDAMIALYDSSPEWLKELMNAWADGLNYYLHTHPEVEPRVIERFEPWMALTFSEGSIGGDIERVNLGRLEEFYATDPVARLTATLSADGSIPEPSTAAPSSLLAARPDDPTREPSGSNGFAIAPSNTEAGHALLLINPHTSFFFRSELHMTSDEGLNAYGAATWGQFFIYQGFNESAGWMHTSSGVDNIDEYLETVVSDGDGLAYVHGNARRPVEERDVTIRYRTPAGMSERTFTIYRTHHGPIVREADGRWISVSLMENPQTALQQSYLRTKAANLEGFLETMRLHTNSSNNTVFADAEGNIAYLHSNFVPRRDTRFDWSRPVDGSDPATDWGEPLSVEESPNVINPPSGWLQNTNNWPYSAAGPYSPKRADYADYVDRSGENPRGLNALRVLPGRTDFTLERLRDAAYDSYLPAFETLVPALRAAFEATPAGDPLRAAVAEPFEAISSWDFRWGVESVPTSLAVYWAEDLLERVTEDAREAGLSTVAYAEGRATPQQHLTSLRAAVERLDQDFGTWRTPWGQINRFQRLTADIVHPFDDGGPSIPVGFTSSRWGSLASFGARTYPGTVMRYGTSGNSFVAVVEFGERVRALAVTAGGESGDPRSPHFNDQAQRYADGDLREVHFYRDQIQAHAERTYRPGS